jgi:hypothetical protein
MQNSASFTLDLVIAKRWIATGAQRWRRRTRSQLTRLAE